MPIYYEARLKIDLKPEERPRPSHRRLQRFNASTVPRFNESAR
jgi:hypothetical protein